MQLTMNSATAWMTSHNIEGRAWQWMDDTTETCYLKATAAMAPNSGSVSGVAGTWSRGFSWHPAFSGRVAGAMRADMGSASG
jgi:hypothetical protein